MLVLTTDDLGYLKRTAVTRLYPEALSPTNLLLDILILQVFKLFQGKQSHQ